MTDDEKHLREILQNENMKDILEGYHFYEYFQAVQEGKNEQTLAIDECSSEKLRIFTFAYDDGISIDFRPQEHSYEILNMILTVRFDLSGKLKDEPWINPKYKNEAAILKNDLLVGQALNPKYIHWFIDQYNAPIIKSYKYRSDSFNDKILQLKNLRAADFNNTLNNIEQIALPEGEIAFSHFLTKPIEKNVNQKLENVPDKKITQKQNKMEPLLSEEEIGFDI